MGLEHLSGPALEPVTLAEAKLYLRIDDAAGDETITLLIKAARELIERETDLVLIRQTKRLHLDGFLPQGVDGLKRILLPCRPIASVVALTVADSSGSVQSVPDTEYVLDAQAAPPRLVEKAVGAWPRPGVAAGGIALTFEAGFGEAAEDVPAGLRLAVLHLIAEAHEGRTLSYEPDGNGAYSARVQDILAPFREVRL